MHQIHDTYANAYDHANMTAYHSAMNTRITDRRK
jgi:hypothetical protein